MSLPVVSFLRALRKAGDLPAILIGTSISAYAAVVLMLPLSETVRRAAQARFHLAGWPRVAWAVFQPVPSMYNFENRWVVTFEGQPPEDASIPCSRTITGFINHHVYNRLLLPVSRVRLEQCGLPARVRFTSTYRGTTVETTYMVRRGPGEHGLIVSGAELE